MADCLAVQEVRTAGRALGSVAAQERQELEVRVVGPLHSALDSALWAPVGEERSCSGQAFQAG